MFDNPKLVIATCTLAGAGFYLYYLNVIKRRYPGPFQLPIIGTLLSALP
jgi:hypothetical protein